MILETDKYSFIFQKQLLKLIDKYNYSTPKYDVKEYLVEFYLKESLHRLVIPSELARIIEELFTNSVARDFILELTELVTINLHTNNSNLEGFIAILAKTYYGNHSYESDYILMPVQIVEALKVNKDIDIVKLFSENTWLTMLAMILIYLDINSIKIG